MGTLDSGWRHSGPGLAAYCILSSASSDYLGPAYKTEFKTD